MIDRILSKYDSDKLSDEAALIMKEGKFLSRREANGFAIFLYAIDNMYAEVCYYLRSHEIVEVEYSIPAKIGI
jgi:hypothetical protein